jgi:hypothetical protein
MHYRNPRLCRERDPLGTGLFALGTACAERELSAERSRHRWAGTGGSAESLGPNSRHSCGESPLSSRHRPIHNWRRELRAPLLCREPLCKLTAQKGSLPRACGRLLAQAGCQVAPDEGGPHTCAESLLAQLSAQSWQAGPRVAPLPRAGPACSRHRACLGRQSAHLCRELKPLLSAQRQLCREPWL